MTINKCRCLLNHAETWDTQVVGCDRPASHLWVRPGRSPLPVCRDGLKPGRERVEMTRADHIAALARLGDAAIVEVESCWCGDVRCDRIGH